MLFKILTLFIASLLPIVSTDCAAANDPVNNDNSLLKPDFKHKESIESIASPAPILSIACLAYAAHSLNLLSFLL